MSTMFPLFSLQVLEKSDYDILDFLYLGIGKFGLILTWCLKHTIITVRTYIQRNLYHIYRLIIFYSLLCTSCTLTPISY